MVERAITKAKRVPRSAALIKVKTKITTKRPVFVVSYDPRLPSVSNMQARHYRSMVSRDIYLKEIFPVQPLTGFRRQPNLRAVVAKGPERYPKRNQFGMKK